MLAPIIGCIDAALTQRKEKRVLGEVGRIGMRKAGVPRLEYPALRERVERCAAKYSPINATQFRELAEMVWWLIALEEHGDALRLLDAMCEVDDESYWMFHALASAFATRAWLHARNEGVAQSNDDANRAAAWLGRELVGHVNLHLQIDVEAESFLGPGDDLLQLLVERMRLRTGFRPVQRENCRGDHLGLIDAGIDRVLSRA